jgi:uncharacterized phage-associated protein
MRPATTNSFDVAIWFLERARAEDNYLQPRKLQCLLFLTQGHFAAAYDGRRMMPSIFVVDDTGPIDPNLYRVFENGRPDVSETPLPEDITVFLDAIWRQYGADDALQLDQLIGRMGASEPEIRSRDGSEVGLDVMQRVFKRQDRKKGKEPRVMKMHDGRPVTVSQWAPPKKTITE